MVEYRVMYYKDLECKAPAYTAPMTDFKAFIKKAKHIAELTGRLVNVEWKYPSNECWQILRSCPTVKDINNVKEQH